MWWFGAARRLDDARHAAAEVCALARAEGGWGVLLASTLLIVAASLHPGHWSEGEGRPSGLDGRLADMLLNVVLYAPFGAALGYRGRSAPRSLVTGVLLSGAIEVIQLGVPGRVAGVSDVWANAAGTIAGWALLRSGPVWARPRPRVAGRFAIGAAGVASAVLAVTGFLLGPSFPATDYVGHRTPEFGHHSVYRGQVLHSFVGGEEIPSGPIPASSRLRSRLLAGEPIQVQAVAGLPVTGLAPLLSINDAHGEVLLVGVDGDDIVYRFRTRAAALGFDSPSLRAPDALRGVGAGDRLTVTIRLAGKGHCIEVDARTTCDLGLTAGTGWALLLYSQGIPPAVHGILNVLWMAGLALPVGYFSRPSWEAGLAVGVMAAALVALPTPVTTGELAGGVAGLLGGLRLQLWPAAEA
jgi:VanZ family protein